MPAMPKVIADRPKDEDVRQDVLSQVLRSMRLQRTRFAKLELRAPWGIRRPESAQFTFFVVARGGALLTVDDEAGRTLAPGDVALLPRGSASMLRDLTGRRLSARDLEITPCSAAMADRWQQGDGPLTELLSGAFAFSEAATHPLLKTLPKVLHLRADDPAASGWLGATVQLLVAEAQLSHDGGALVLERLAEVLLVHALRLHARQQGSCAESGLRALSDPVIARALQQIHDAPGVDWTVERLATQVGLSRSSFSARFTALVGEPPLRYLTRWRVTRASERLRDGHDSIASIAATLGYESEAAFHRAFKRWRGIGPGAYRRSARITG
jgi:AraC-like DNA-binding protein